MERYNLLGSELLMMPDGFGEWVKHEDAEKLKELNREMVELLKDCSNRLGAIAEINDLKTARILARVDKVIVKAGEG